MIGGTDGTSETGATTAETTAVMTVAMMIAIEIGAIEGVVIVTPGPPGLLRLQEARTFDDSLPYE